MKPAPLPEKGVSMKILVIADKESKALWDFYEPGKLDEYGLILSCGDLAPQYLSFLATFTAAPVLYVHGNHDDCYEQTPPDGCLSVDGTLAVYKGIRILGLGGSMRYKKGINQYSDAEMDKRLKKLRFKLRRHKGCDILLTHSPAFRLGDDDDLPHRGFTAFLTILDRYKPRYFIHGHVHTTYGRKFKREYEYGVTKIVNAYETYVIDYPDELLTKKSNLKWNAGDDF